MRHPVVIAALVLLMASSVPKRAAAEERVERNIVYGMYSGLALLMDVYHPADPNGYGIVVISGSGWHAPLSLDARPLKQGVDRADPQTNALLDSGFTLFAINHRAAPGFAIPLPLKMPSAPCGTFDTMRLAMKSTQIGSAHSVAHLAGIS